MANDEHLDDADNVFLSSELLACPQRGHWVSFQLVDEQGDGAAYAGLNFELLDCTGQRYQGQLDADGIGRVDDFFRGPATVLLDKPYQSGEKLYTDLMSRPSYPLPITELQVRAEKTRFAQADASRTRDNPARSRGDAFYQVEVRELVRHAAHLPPAVARHYPPEPGVIAAMRTAPYLHEEPVGLGLLPNRHYVLEVRPLRALRPMLSTASGFCALNLYQLALMAAMSYNPFGQEPASRPVDQVSFPLDPSVGHFFATALGNGVEAWRVDPAQSSRYYPLYEDVAYSRRFEILPFDPSLYTENDPDLGAEQEHPARLHFFDDADGGTHTQAFITHHDDVVLISVRGTEVDSKEDILRDIDARQVAFREGEGKVHRGFYGGYLAIKSFIVDYLERFHINQKVVICGHSLGGAIAQLLAEALRRVTERQYNVQLYTYGAPRAGDADFVRGAAALEHYRVVSHNDPVPSLPAPWMNVKPRWLSAGGLLAVFNPVGGAVLFTIGLLRFGGEPYQHQGQLLHFTPLDLGQGQQSSVLWEPGCDLIEQNACSRALRLNRNNDLPVRAGFINQLLQAADHFMVAGYIPHTWATLRRWQQTEERGGTLVTERELEVLSGYLAQNRQAMSDLYETYRQQWTGRRTKDDRALELAMSALRAEMRKLDETQQRVTRLHYRQVSLADVYGNLSAEGGLSEALARWQAHDENQAQVQLAQLPSARGRIEQGALVG